MPLKAISRPPWWLAALLLPISVFTAWGQSGNSAPLGELFASVPGAAAEAQQAGSGMPVTPGSELSAGVAAATLKLARGGQVRICPHTSLSVNTAGSGLMLGMGAGAVEIDYRAGDGADFLSTPDFNIRLADRAAYHFALGVNSHGDTCFKPLSGNNAGVLVSELMGTESFGTAPNEAMVFAGGKIAGRTGLNENCGCPALPTPVLHAEGQAAPVHNQADANPTSTPSIPRDVTAPLPPAQRGESHVVVDTPFVYSATSDRPAITARLQFSALPNTVFAQEEPVPAVLREKPADVSANSARKDVPPKSAQEPKQEKGFLARMKGFFKSLFHR